VVCLVHSPASDLSDAPPPVPSFPEPPEGTGVQQNPLVAHTVSRELTGLEWGPNITAEKGPTPS